MDGVIYENFFANYCHVAGKTYIDHISASTSTKKHGHRPKPMECQASGRPIRAIARLKDQPGRTSSVRPRPLR